MAGGIILPRVDFAAPSQVPVAAATLNGVARTPQETQATLAAANAPLRLIFGRCLLGVQLANLVPANGGYWVYQVIWGEGPLDALEALYGSDQALPAGSLVTSYGFDSTAVGSLGTPGAIDPALAAAFAFSGITYTDTLPGIAYSVVRIPYSEEAGGLPRLTGMIRGLKVRDPRTGTTGWSDNPSLCLARFLESGVFGCGVTVNDASLIEAANANDELVGGEKRRRLALVIDQAQEVNALVETLRTYAACWVVPDGDEVRLVPDRPRAVDASYDHAAGQILSLSPLKKRGIAQAPTVIELRYTDTSQIPWREASVFAYAPGADTSQPPSQVALFGIPSASQAQREVNERLNKLRVADLSFDLEVFDIGARHQVGDVIAATHPLGLSAKEVRVLRVQGDYGSYRLSCAEYDAAAYSDTVVVGPSTPDTRLPNPLTTAIAAPTNAAVVEEIYTTRDGAVSSRLRLTWDGITDPWQNLIEYRIGIVRATDGAGSGGMIVGYFATRETEAVFAPLEDGYWYLCFITAARQGYPLNSENASASVQALGKLLPPANVTSLAHSVTPTGLVLSWPDVIDIDLKGYELREGVSWAAGAQIATTAQKVTTINLGFVALGSHTYWIKARDWSGNESAVATSTTATLAALGAVGALGVSLAQADATLAWTAPASAWPLAHYELRYGASWEAATPLAQTRGTTHKLAVDWLGARSFWVAALDAAGNVGTPASVSLSINAPGAVSPAAQIIGAKAALSWAPAASSLPVAHYEVRHGASWGAGAVVVKTAATDYRVPLDWAPGARTFWVAAVDVNGNVAPAASVVVTIAAPAAPTLSQAISLDTLNLAWTVPAATLPILDYEVRHGASWGAGTSLGRVLGTTFSLPVNWAGERTFWVAARDVNGNVGAAGSVGVVISAPTAPTSMRAEAVDNNVLLYWDGATATLPIKTYRIKKGASWAGGTLIGEKSGGFTSIFETVGGVYTYWVAGVDTANNEGTPRSFTVSVTQPQDYVLNQVWHSTFSGTSSNVVVDTDGSRIMGANTSETWQSHFTSRGWNSPQDQINAGYPVFIEPAALPAWYEEVFDYGAVLAGTEVQVTQGGLTVSGTPLLVSKISTSLDNSTWIDYDGLWSVFGTNFRYVKVRITCTGGQYDLQQLTVILKNKIKNDALMVACVAGDANGTLANFNVEFVDVAAIVPAPAGTSALLAIYEFKDAWLSGTYSVSANVCTVNVTAHEQIVGQKVKLAFASGTAPIGVYTVASVPNANSFTVALTTANTSGNVSMYSQGCRIRLFNDAGVRQSGTASVQIRGY